MLTSTTRGLLFAVVAALLLWGLFSEEALPLDLSDIVYVNTRELFGIPYFANLLSEVLLMGSTLFGLWSIRALTRRGWIWATWAKELWLSVSSLSLHRPSSISFFT